MTDYIKICRQCGAEFVASAMECSDCGGQLVASAPNEAPPAPLEDTEELVLIRADSRSYVKDLARVLHERGVPTTVHLQEMDTACSSKSWKWILLVRPTDAEKAAAIDREYWLRHSVQESDVEVTAKATDTSTCPACGGKMADDVEECPSCGLWLGE